MTGGRLIAGNTDNAIRTVWLRVDFESSDRYSAQPVLSAVLEIKIVLFLLNNEKGKKRLESKKIWQPDENLHTDARFVNRFNFLFGSIKIGPRWCFKSVKVLVSRSTCNASSTAAGLRGSKGGYMQLFKYPLSALHAIRKLGGRLWTSFINPSKNASRCDTVGIGSSTQLSFVRPNHALMLRGRSEKVHRQPRAGGWSRLQLGYRA